MSKQNIASQLLQGSRNIDRMKEEIVQLVSMILGALNRLDNLPDFIPTTRFVCNDCYWTIERSFRNKDFSATRVYCAIGRGNSNEGTFSCGQGITSFDNEYVKITHEHLSLFVEGMFGTFPGLREKMAFLIDASIVAF